MNNGQRANCFYAWPSGNGYKRQTLFHSTYSCQVDGDNQNGSEWFTKVTINMNFSRVSTALKHGFQPHKMWHICTGLKKLEFHKIKYDN